MKNNYYIAYCGLDCEKCEARIATLKNDVALKAKVAAEWSELNGVEITPDMINCDGCRVDGMKTPYCESMCPVRKCATEKGCAVCGLCPEFEKCEKVAAITANNPEALLNLRNIPEQE